MGVHRFELAATVIAGRRREMDSMVNAVSRQAMRGASDYVTAETPVKIGIARSNWVATVAQPFEGVLPAYAPFPDLGHDAAPPERKLEESNRDAARAQNRTAFDLFDYLKHGVIFLRNNAWHIGLLNDGHSAQTERRFFERGVAAARKAMLGSWRLRP